MNEVAGNVIFLYQLFAALLYFVYFSSAVRRKSRTAKKIEPISRNFFTKERQILCT